MDDAMCVTIGVWWNVIIYKTCSCLIMFAVEENQFITGLFISILASA